MIDELLSSRLEEEEDLEQEMTELEVKIEQELEERRKKMRGPYAKYSNSPASSPCGSSSAHEDTPTGSPAPPSPAGIGSLKTKHVKQKNYKKNTIRSKIVSLAVK